METLECEIGRKKAWILAALIWLLALQDPLRKIVRVFAFFDELIVLAGALMSTYIFFVVKQKKREKGQLPIRILLMLFFCTGLLGNLIYRYQPWKPVIVDMYTHLKFFFAILTGCVVSDTMSLDDIKKQCNLHGRVISGMLFVLFLLDRLFEIWPGGIRLGMRTAVLFYSHPSYLAGTAAFLIAMMTVFYEKKNLPFIGMCLVLLVFTLRSKAFASAAIFVAVFVLFVLLKQKMKLWYILLAAAACVIIAWPQISFYFIELGGRSTRSVMHSVGFQIMKDYFPIGTGFGTYASAEAAKVFSPVYEIYDFEYLLRFEANRQWIHFLNDTFWPIIIGQTGAIGTVAYVSALALIFAKCWKIQTISRPSFAAIMYIWAHVMVCSTAEPAFNNATAIPLAFVMGIVLRAADNKMFMADLQLDSK